MGRRSPPGPNADQISSKLDEIEAELKAIGFWDDNRPPAVGGFLSDSGFKAWLQTVFLPNARDAVSSGTYPGKKSEVGLMALRQYDYHGTVPEAQRLTTLLHQFDDLVNALQLSSRPAKQRNRARPKKP